MLYVAGRSVRSREFGEGDQASGSGDLLGWPHAVAVSR